MFADVFFQFGNPLFVIITLISVVKIYSYTISGNFKPHIYLMSLFIAASLFAVLISILTYLERGPSHIAKLKKNLIAIYIEAIEKSSINPIARDKK